MTNRITGRYSDILLRKRGETIARNEALWGARAGQYDGVRQQIDAGRIEAQDVKLVWDSTGPDGRTRDSHLAMEGQTVPYGQPFVSPVTGGMMMFPGDTSLSAPPEEVIMCRCTMRLEIDRYRTLT